MSKYDEKFEEMTLQEEILLESIYKRKLAHLDAELKVRMDLGDKGFRVIEPKFEYENTPAYIEHLKNALVLSVEEEKIKIKAALNNIVRNKLHREELADAKKERESNAR